jgi:homopolymeric O-antigen transport system ATP-binding protein
MSSIDAQALAVRFFIDRRKRLVTPGQARLRRGISTVYGLKDVSFAAEGGEAIALVGPSGSGKTTLLRTLAGVYEPDEGELLVRGRVGSLLSIEAGLLWSLTGRENARLLAVLAGVKRRGAGAAVEQIKERTLLEDAFERPVASFSQGMRARLGFAVAEYLEPTVLVLDEVHEALDHEFRRYIADRAREIVERGGIVVAAGHDHDMLATFCTRALWLSGGRVQSDGPFEGVRREYLSEAA